MQMMHYHGQSEEGMDYIVINDTADHFFLLIGPGIFALLFCFYLLKRENHLPGSSFYPFKIEMNVCIMAL